MLLHILSSLLSHSFLLISSLSPLPFPFHSNHLNSYNMPHILVILSSFTTILSHPSSCFHPSFIVTLHYSFPIYPSLIQTPQILPISPSHKSALFFQNIQLTTLLGIVLGPTWHLLQIQRRRARFSSRICLWILPRVYSTWLG